MSFNDITRRLFSEKQVCLQSKTLFFCSACGSSISQAIYGKIKAYVNSGCVFSLIEPVNMPHMRPDALKCHWNKQECLGNFHTRACSFRFTVIQKKKQKYICSGYWLCRFKINVESAWLIKLQIQRNMRLRFTIVSFLIWNKLFQIL